MIKVSYDRERNVIINEFEGNVDVPQVQQLLIDIQHVLPDHGKDLKLLTDLTLLESMDPKVQDDLTKAMDYFNAQGVTKVLRVIPDTARDIGFNILSIFHYSKGVKILTLESREEAMERLENKKIRN